MSKVADSHFLVIGALDSNPRESKEIKRTMHPKVLPKRFHLKGNIIRIYRFTLKTWWSTSVTLASGTRPDRGQSLAWKLGWARLVAGLWPCWPGDKKEPGMPWPQAQPGLAWQQLARAKNWEGKAKNINGHVVRKQGALEAAVTGCQKISENWQCVILCEK